MLNEGTKDNAMSRERSFAAWSADRRSVFLCLVVRLHLVSFVPDRRIRLTSLAMLDSAFDGLVA